MFDWYEFTTEYARLANPAGTKFAVPAPANIRLPVICRFAF